MPEEQKLMVEPYNGYHSEINSHAYNIDVTAHKAPNKIIKKDTASPYSTI
jgi:hypothetical protein